MEVVFVDSKFLARIFQQMTDTTALLRITTPKEKLDFVREVFSVHLIIALFVNEKAFNYSGLNMIAADNLREVA